MIKKFLVSKKLNQIADQVEEDAGKTADFTISAVKKFNEVVEFSGVVSQVIASLFRLVRISLITVTTDSEEGKAFRSLLIELEKTFAKKIRDSAGFVTVLVKNPKIMKAVEAFEEDWVDLKKALRKEQVKGWVRKLDSIHDLAEMKFDCRRKTIAKFPEDRRVLQEELTKFTSVFRKYFEQANELLEEELDQEGPLDIIEPHARVRHLEYLLDIFPSTVELQKDERGCLFWEDEGGKHSFGGCAKKPEKE